MKIKNDLISIRVGKKQYDFNNLILDEYLKRFSKSQLTIEENKQNEKALDFCLIKFDESIGDVGNDTELHNADFDICIMSTTYNADKKNQNIYKNQIITQYNYETENTLFGLVYDYNKNTSTDISIEDYYGRKISAIGFNTTFSDDTNLNIKNPICTVLDTSNYNIYLQENQDFAVTRKDIITTDALFYSNNTSKVSGPIHLAPIPNKAVKEPNIITSRKL